jgi:DNA polymerase
MKLDGSGRYRFLLSLRSEAAMGLRSTRGSLSTSDVTIDEAEHAGEKVPMPPLVVAAPMHTTVAPRAGTAPVEMFADATEPMAPLMSISTAPITLPLLSTKQKTTAFAEMNAREVSVCKKCRLCTTRTQTVFGEGDVDAKIFFIGEGPGETEDQTGRPFVGRAGQLLDKMIAAMGITRQQVFIANIVKCRPPDNRVPAPDEVATCTPYLVRQLEIVRPKVIVTLGLPAVKYMLEDQKLTMGRVRGQWKSWRGIKLMPTYHPSYVLRSYTEANRQAVWSDLQLVMKEIGLEPKRTASKT